MLTSAAIPSYIEKYIECVNATPETEGAISPTYRHLLHLEYFFTLLFKTLFEGRARGRVAELLHILSTIFTRFCVVFGDGLQIDILQKSIRVNGIE
jgi:hypothetical protein